MNTKGKTTVKKKKGCSCKVKYRLPYGLVALVLLLTIITVKNNYFVKEPLVEQPIPPIVLIEKSIEEVLDKVLPSVVSVEATMPPRDFGLHFPITEFEGKAKGSGSILTEDGIILTNAHVIAISTSVTIRLYNGNEYEAEIINFDEAKDLAVLQIIGLNEKLIPIKFAKNDDVRVGEAVFVIGNPCGYEHSVSKGIVSGINRKFYGGEDLIQTDASINPGNSGGVLVNIRGELLGVPSLKLFGRGIESMGFAIPVKRVQGFLLDVLGNVFYKNSISNECPTCGAKLK